MACKTRPHVTAAAPAPQAAAASAAGAAQRRRQPPPLLLLACLLLLAAAARPAAASSRWLLVEDAGAGAGGNATAMLNTEARVRDIASRTQQKLRERFGAPEAVVAQAAAATAAVSGLAAASGRAYRPPRVPARNATTVQSCAQLGEMFAQAREWGLQRTSGLTYVTITLDCVNGVFNDCGDMVVENNVIMFLEGRVSVTVQLPKAGCATRPTLTGGVGGSPSDASDFFYVFGRTARLTLKNFDIDCGDGLGADARRGIWLEDSGLVTLENVNIRNCVSPFGPALFSSSSTVVVKGGTFSNNVAATIDGDPYPTQGGAFFFYAGSPFGRGHRFTVTGATFEGNTADAGGAMFVLKTGKNTIGVTLTSCKFIDNTVTADTGLCTVLATMKADNIIEGRSSSRLVIDISRSDFTSQDGDGEDRVMCGEATIPFARSRVRLTRLVLPAPKLLKNVAPAAIYSLADQNDFEFTLKAPTP